MNQQLDHLAEAYFEEALRLNPTLATSIGDERYNHLYTASFSEEIRNQSRALDEKYAASLQTINRQALDEEHQLTYDVFRRNLENALRGYQFPSPLQPLNQFYNFGSGFAQLGSGTGIHPFKRVKDYDDFLSRTRGFTEAVDIAIANMRQGMAMGVVQPRVLMEASLPQLSAHVVSDVEKSLFYGPIRNLPADFTQADRERLTAAYRTAIRDQVPRIPQAARLCPGRVPAQDT